MPSNSKLIKEIATLAEELGVQVETDDLNNTQLAAKLSELKAMSRKDDASAPEEPAHVEQKAPAKKAKKPPFTVGMGKSITSKRGILEDGEEVKASDLPGGEGALQKLVDVGVIDDNQA